MAGTAKMTPSPKAPEPEPLHGPTVEALIKRWNADHNPSGLVSRRRVHYWLTEQAIPTQKEASNG